MSFIAGTKILSTRATRSDPKRVARLGLATLMKMIFEDGFVHADLHPGNIFITPDDKLALLDLGLVGELDEPHRKGVRALVRGLGAARRRRDGAHHERHVGQRRGRPDADPERLRALSRRHHRVRRAATGASGSGRSRSARCCWTCWASCGATGCAMNPSFTIVNIAIAVTEGIGKQLDPELDLMHEALPYFLAQPVRARPPTRPDTQGTAGGA